MADQQKDSRRASGEPPRYKLLERAYIDDKLLEEGTEIVYEGVPGYHMDPVNAPAHAMKEKHPSQYIDPIAAMTNIATASESELAAERLAAALKAALLPSAA